MMDYQCLTFYLSYKMLLKMSSTCMDEFSAIRSSIVNFN